jgi:NADH-quinone oxidoreductase subunit J
VSPVFVIIAFVTLLAAAAAMSLRNLVHCALSLVVALAGLAALYLQLDAQFVGFAQILVYVGAVAILIVFAVLLTRSDATPNQAILAPGWIVGILVSAVVFAMLGWGLMQNQKLGKRTYRFAD